MEINGTLSMLVAPDGNIRFKAFETTALGSPVATKDYDAPVANPLNFTITVPNDVPHIVKIYDSPGTTDGTLLADFLYDPKFSSIDIKVSKVYTVGDDNAPTAGSTSFTDTDLDGWKFDLERRGIGTLINGTEWDYVDGGGFKLLQTGDKFGAGETFIVHFMPKITTVTPSGATSTKFIADIADPITADKTLDDTYYNQLIPINSATNKITITLPSISGVPAMTLFAFITNMGSQINATIKTTGTDSIFWNNTSRSAIYMGKNEQLFLLKGTSGWYVLEANGGFLDVGRQFISDMILANTIERDGSLLNRDTYPRLFNDYVKNLPAAMIVSESTWSTDSTTNRGKFTMGDGSTTFRICDSRGLFVRSADDSRGIDSGRSVGSYQDSAVKSHDHLLAKNGSYTQGNNAIRAQGTIGLDNKYTLQGDSGDADTYHVSKTGETESRPQNEAKIPLIAV